MLVNIIPHPHPSCSCCFFLLRCLFIIMYFPL
jgi:hypothetical protein